MPFPNSDSIGVSGKWFSMSPRVLLRLHERWLQKRLVGLPLLHPSDLRR